MFDPYYKWLGIPPKDQPPNHYRLLSLELFEKDLDVIEGSADRLMGFVRQYQSGEHAELAAKILNEIATARLCLLKPSTKAEYDAKLKQKVAPKEPPKDDVADFANDTDLAEQVRASKPAPRPVSRSVTKKRGKAGQSFPKEYLLAGVALVLIVLPAVAFLWPKRVEPIQQTATPPNNSNPPASHTATPAKQISATPKADSIAKPILNSPTTNPQTPTSPSSAETDSIALPKDATGPAIDLLASVDASRDLIMGDIKKDGLAYQFGPTAAFYLPARLPEDYQLRAKVTRTSGVDTFFLGFVMGGRQGSVAFDAYNSEMSGLFVGSNELHGFCATGPGSLLKKNQVSNIVLVIHPRHFTAQVDGATIVDWYGDPSRLDCAGRYRESAGTAAANATFRIESAIVVPIPPEPAEDRIDTIASEIDVMPLLDAKRDSERGIWSVVDNILHCNNGTGSLDIYSLPVAVPDEYTLSMNAEIDVNARSSQALVLGLLARQTQFTIPIANDVSSLGIEQIDGNRWVSNETLVRGNYLTPGKISKIVCTVTKQRISLEIDGRLLINWTGDQRRLSVEETWASRNGRRLYLGARTHFKISDLKIGPPVDLPRRRDLTKVSSRGAADLLAIIEPARDEFEGDWVKDKKFLRANGDAANNKLVIPCDVPTEYRLKLRVAREKGGKVDNDTLMLNLPVGPYTANVSIDAVGSTVSGIHLDRLNVNDPKNPSSRKGQVIPMGGPRDIDVTVRKNSIKVNLGTREILNWVGNPARLWMNPEWSTPSGLIALGSWGSRLRFEKIELEALEPSDIDELPSVADLGDAGDLLAVINPTRDSRLGDWKIDQGALVCPMNSPARLRIPTPVFKQYCLSANVERFSGQNDFMIGLVVDGHPSCAIIDGWASSQAGMMQLDRKSFHDEVNLTRRDYSPSLLPVGQKVPVQCFVLPDTIIVNCGGKEIIRWHGDARRLSANVGHQPPNFSKEDESHLWLGGWESSFAFRDLKLKSLSDEEAARIRDQFSGPYPLSLQAGVPLASSTIQP